MSAGPSGEASISEPRPGILTVTLHRGVKCNAMTPNMWGMLWDGLNAVMDRDDLRCLVITAVPVKGYFTSGVDLALGFGSRPANPDTADLHPGWSYRRNYRSGMALYDEFEHLEKPIVFAAPGHVLGSGVEMAVSCDFRFCTPDTTWRLPEPHLGAIAGAGGTSRLTRIVGPHWGKWMAMAGMPISAQQALSIGLVHEIFPADGFLDAVYRFCADLSNIPAETLGIAKLVVDISVDIDRTNGRHVDRIANTTLSNGSRSILARTARFRKGAVPPGWKG